MTNEIRALTTAPREMTVLPEEQLELLRHTYAKDLNPAEFDMFVAAARRLRLDPFAGQVVAIKRGGRVSIQTTIDGFRSKAEETGEYEGQTSPQWCGEDGQWRDVWLSKAPPHAARVGVYRRGFREPMFAIAAWGAYDQGSGWWKKAGGGAHMLAKCAEALALRKAFPSVLGGIYTRDEMGTRDEDVPEARVESPRAQRGPAPVEAAGEWEEAPETPPVKAAPAPAPEPKTPPAKPEAKATIEPWAKLASENLVKAGKLVPYEVAVRQFFAGEEPPAWTWTPEGCQRMGRGEAMQLYRGLNLWGHALKTLKLTEKEISDLLKREFGAEWLATLTTPDAVKAAGAVLEEYAATRGE